MTDSELIVSAFLQDPAVLKAKQTLLETAKKYQSQIKGVSPANPQLKTSYEELIHAMNTARGSKLWYPYLGSGIGNGALVELLDGSVKYDFICGIGVHYLGHSHPKVISAQLDAALTDTVMQGHLQQNQDSLLFSNLLVKASGLDHCFLTTSGAVANENALKIALQKKFPAQRVLAFDRCFVGRTLTLAQISDKPKFREGLPLNIAVDYIPFYDPQREDESLKEAVLKLKKVIARYPKEHAVMIFELVQGEAGFYPGSEGFFKTVMTILKEHGIAIFIDEIQTFGRTTELFCFKHFHLEDFVDIVSIGKLSQCCATLFREEFKPRAGLLSQTYTGATAAIRAGYAIIEHLLNNGFFGKTGRIQKIQEFFHARLKELENRYPNKIKGPFGIGSMVAFTPFDGDEKKVSAFAHKLFENGVISFIAGDYPTKVRFLVPAGVITEDDILQVITIVEKTLLEF